MKIVVIGVGSPGVTVADKIDIPDCSKIFIDSEEEALTAVKSEGEAILLRCKEREECYCHCYMYPEDCKRIAESCEEEIRQAITAAFSK